jgi:hypothetical protein
VLARRSNPQVSAWGAVVSASGPSGASDAWKLAAAGQSGPVDVLASFTTPSGLATWHTQLQPGISLTAKPRALSHKHGVHMTFHALDAGSPLSGVAISLAGKHATTNGAGVASIDAGPIPANHATATASKGGYTPAHLKLRVG